MFRNYLLNNKAVLSLVCTTFLVTFIVTGCGLKMPAFLTGEPKLLDDAKPGDCTACHGDKSVLPSEHENTLDMTIEQCDQCHKSTRGHKNSLVNEKTKGPILRGKISLSHLHILSDVSCIDCHGKSRPVKPLSTDDCYSCHENLDDIIYRTSNIDPNPHENHYGGLDCDLCHRQHSKSENFCDQVGCHEFGYIVP
jgi:hypothetical protein